MMKRHLRKPGQGGFTLVEAVLVIVILGIVAGMVAVFIVMPVRAYKDSAARAELTDIGDLALRRMARDIRLALPNSVRVRNNGRTIEFLQTKAGGRYLAVEDDHATGTPLDFLDATKKSFQIVGDLPTGKQAIIPGQDYLVVNNLGMVPVDAYQFASGTQRNIARITGVNSAAGVHTITLDDNPFATQVPPMPSPSARFQIVSGPVTYHCVPETVNDAGDGTLSRQWNYDITALWDDVPLALPAPVGRPASNAVPQSSYIAKRIKACRFTYETVATQRSAILHMELDLYLPETGTVNLKHQIHVDNTP
jgi:MSHA biogenesis protein MshO